MFNALRRVISDASEVGGDPNQQQTTTPAETATMTGALLQSPTAAPAIVVEDSQNVSHYPTSLSDGGESSQDRNRHDIMEEDDDDNNNNTGQADADGDHVMGINNNNNNTRANLATAGSNSVFGAVVSSARAATSTETMDSSAGSRAGDSRSSDSHKGAASSQTSSRDWGWFEDEVHVADVGFLSAQLPTPGSFHGNSIMSGSLNHRGGSHDSNDDGAPKEIIHAAPHDDEAAAMAVTAPNYVLEESLSSQRLWHDTAGTRPPQPAEERQFFERMWAQNFAQSEVKYAMPVDVLTAGTPISLNPFADGVFEGSAASPNYYIPQGEPTHPQGGTGDSQDGNSVTEAALVARMTSQTNDDGATSPASYRVPGTKSDGDLTVLLRGPNGFGTTVSKSFARSTENGAAIVGVDTVNISIASYRVVESKKYGKFAQFLVIYREGGIRDTVGVWKRYRDFEELSNKVTQAHEGCAAVIANMSPLAMTEEPETEHLPNAIMSWRLLKKRKRWYRCLDANYLSLKVFLLERFLHDILFESSSPNLLREFVLGQEAATN